MSTSFPSPPSEQTACKSSELQGEHVRRINRAVDFIQENLREKITIEEAARAAAYSPFHFSRIFREIMGETVGRYIRKERLIKASHDLVYNPRVTVSEIALDYGFSSAQNFARDFKRLHGISPSALREKAGDFRDRDTFWWRVNAIWRSYLDIRSGRVEVDPAGEPSVAVRPPLRLAYIRLMGERNGPAELIPIMQRLLRWAEARNVLAEDRVFVIPHCDPNLVDEKHLRREVAVAVTSDAEPDGEIGITVMPERRCAWRTYNVTASTDIHAVSDFLVGWLPDSGYRVNDTAFVIGFSRSYVASPDIPSLMEVSFGVAPI